MGSKIILKISREDIIPALKCPKCEITSHLSNTCTKKTKIDEFKYIEEVQCADEKEKSEQYSEFSEDTTVEKYYIENNTAFFEVTEVHSPLPNYSEDWYSMIKIQDARIHSTKPSRGKEYTAGESCIRLILINDYEDKGNLDTGAFCTFIGKDNLQIILPEWKNIFYCGTSFYVGLDKAVLEGEITGKQF
ncbi:hypothetical protein O181_109665 [Austropuccinia psidii MF-1]|uniref:Uncharacterized protein n=1 Tax=Austropuccinia psidii MF-1 TaxID=1389203 RepID=A0A9Q3JYW3_9BASI|nr:hypothetical protein [Austropuccinia psidii MF-1]